MPFAVGETVGPYRIVAQLGQGGMATVYKGYHANLDRYVAIKVMHPAFKEDPNFLERFKREAQIVAKLDHPAIIPVYDFADVYGQPYLVMKYVEGETLKAHLQRRSLTFYEIVQVMDVVADGLTFAHQQGILHRDIKPSNIMLDGRGSSLIADFGLARIAQAGESTLSQDMMLGTPQYISPEQAQGVRELGPSTDIYSLGVVLYEMVVGRVPFTADTPYAIIHDHIYKPLPLPSQVNPEVPAAVERVLLKALAKAPEDRFQSAVELMAAFRQAVAETGLTELSTASYSIEERFVPPLTPSPPGVPSPGLTASGGLAGQQTDWRHTPWWKSRSIGWLLLGLICFCVIAFVISGPARRSRRDADKTGPDDILVQATPSPSAGYNLSNLPLDISVEQAQALVAEQPDSPVLHLALALALFREGRTDEALTEVLYAPDQAGLSPDLLAAAAQQIDATIHPEIAAWLYLEIIASQDLSPRQRSEAGEYLFTFATDHPAAFLAIVDRAGARYANNATVYALQGLAQLQTDRALMRAQARRSFEQALNLDDTLAEIYLMRGVFYQVTGDITLARQDWEHAISFDDAPPWVVTAARQKLEESK